MSFFKLGKELFQYQICSVTYAPGNRQHNSRTAERSAFKFPDKKADCDESEYDANYSWFSLYLFVILRCCIHLEDITLILLIIIDLTKIVKNF
jgi:hypothetical protein